jgi:hypothetical protein
LAARIENASLSGWLRMKKRISLMDFIHQGWQPGRAGQQGKHKSPENNETQHAENVVKKRSYSVMQRILTDIIKIHCHPSWL